MKQTKVLTSNETDMIETSWGKLTWYANQSLGNSTTLTVGKCLIKPACENPLHSHPNCSEILTVIEGEISHTIEGGAELTMTAGDTISIPARVPHKARNIGDCNAVLYISFDSAVRETEKAGI